MNESHGHWRTATGWSLATLVAVLVAFFGFQFAQGDQPELLPAEPTAPPGFETPPPDLPTPAPIPLDYDLYPPPVEVTPAPVTSVTINGILVQLVPGMTYNERSGGPSLPRPGSTPFQGQSGSYYSIMYDRYPERIGTSSVYFDDGATEGSHVLMQFHILPEDQAIFQPVLDALH